MVRCTADKNNQRTQSFPVFIPALPSFQLSGFSDHSSRSAEPSHKAI
jgi:hypothetical protein